MPFCYDMWPSGSDASKRSRGIHVGFDAFGRSSYTAGRSVPATELARADQLPAGAEVFADLGRTRRRGSGTVTVYDRIVVAGKDPSIGRDYLEQPVGGKHHPLFEKGPMLREVRIVTGPKADVPIDLPGDMLCVPTDIDWYKLTGTHVQVTVLDTPGRVLVLGQGYGWAGCVWRIGLAVPTSLRDGVYVPSGDEQGSWVPAIIRGR